MAERLGVEMDKRLEAGWFQRIVWSVLAWGSLGMLVWVPFLYVAIRRGRGSDWGAFAAFVVYECTVMPGLFLVPDDSDGSAVLGLVMLLSLLAATGMLLFAVFDRRTPQAMAAAGYGAAPSAATVQQGPYGYPYGR
ncbi:hypothetical protein ACF09J_13175 [Streptomyces sp. NPDC014889]|uniref:hypothetical protein n=1 Tax=Streptomyces sp. NPDC014889 TaxID=3364928 RepID=UPI0036FC25E6